MTAIELMPVAQFPGTRNWGYDGAYLFAVQASYGGPDGLKRLVDAAHALGLAVVLDVVYNHLGPEGNYLSRFGPYFTDRYTTPWGQAVNYDGQDGAGVRRFVIENAVRWIRDFHLDGLRLDAVHSIFDQSTPHILADLAEAVHAAAGARQVHLIAESDLNDVRLITPVDEEGYGLDAQWNDDFHHALHALLTAERDGYYGDYGTLRALAKAYAEGFVYTGEYSHHRERHHGTPSRDQPLTRFVVCTQNHDQTGNRMLGERLAHLVAREELLLAAGALLLGPYVPMLFMGQEYAERAPFLYFVSHSDPDLIAAVQAGRQREFAAFHWRGDVPDPQDEGTFVASRLDHGLKARAEHRVVLEFHRELLRLRRAVPALRSGLRDHHEVTCLEAQDAIVLRCWQHDREALVILHFGAASSVLHLPVRSGTWRRVLDSADARWLGPGGSLDEAREVTGDLSVTVWPTSVCLWLYEP